MNLRFLQIITLFSQLAQSFAGAQTTYYVSVAGNNNNNGLTPQTAFETLQHAANNVSAGDSVLTLEGNYIGFDIRTDGTQNSPIVFKAIENNVVIFQKSSRHHSEIKPVQPINAWIC